METSGPVQACNGIAFLYRDIEVIAQIIHNPCNRWRWVVSLNLSRFNTGTHCGWFQIWSGALREVK